MQRPFRTLLTSLALLGLSSVAQATLIEVSQGGVSLGFINSYSDASGNTSAQNYNFFSSENHLITGPTLSNQAGHIFFFEGSDGLSFNSIFGSVGTAGPQALVSWDLSLTGNVGDAAVLVADDGGELSESSADNFTARWRYIQSFGDGGVIGALSGDQWTLTIDPVAYINLPVLTALDADGNDITLEINTADDIVFSFAPPVSASAPGTVGLLGLALAGIGYAARRRRQEEA